MRIDLMQLRDMHPLLPVRTAAELEHRAAIGLERHHHRPGVSLTTTINDRRGTASLNWLPADSDAREQLDRHRVTEDAAEAIALALVHAAEGWVVRRRCQRGESADWLLQAPTTDLVALEISGTDRGDDAERLRVKRAQVRLASVAKERAACVVELSTPRATVAKA